MFKVCVWALVASFCILGTFSQPVVDSPTGQIMGQYANNMQVKQFLGIPYGKPPVDELRFKLPEPIERFQDPFIANTYASACAPNKDGSEDCLYLNVYVPVNVSMDSPVPVMVWIHGGGFQGDTAARYDATTLAAVGNVIVVVPNYRLGVFGFLNAEESDEANFGLWDQRLALLWVKENIASFGGSLSNVTLMGESAGAAGAAFHALTLKSQGLFTRMILQSGTAVAPFAFNREPRRFAVSFAKRLGCKDNDPILPCLRKKKTHELVSESAGMATDLGMSVIDFTWVPSVDGHFVVDDPNSLIKNTTHLDSVGFYEIDLLMGMNNDEGSLVFTLAGQKNISMDPVNGVSKEFYEDHFVPAIVQQKFGVSNKQADLALTHMYEFRTILENRTMLSNTEWFRTYADATFLSPITAHALAHSLGGGKGKTYLYLFDHVPSYNTKPQVTGTEHGGDVPFVFGFRPFTGSEPLPFSPKEFELSNNVMRYWTNMAKSGSPNMPDMDGPIAWPEFDQSQQIFLKLSTQMTSSSIGMGLLAKRAEFWLEFMPSIIDTPKYLTTTEKLPQTTRRPVQEARTAAFIDRFSLDSTGAEAAIIGLAVVVAILAALVLVMILVVCVMNRRLKSKYDLS